MNKEEFIKYLDNLNIKINDDKINKLEKYKDLLIEWNNKFNLTSITSEEDIYLKHFYDSLCIVKSTDFNNKEICDFGTGAGFPGMVLAIVFDNSNITLLESNGKKITFLNEVKKELDLSNVTIINSRAEDYGKKHREIFDIVTCRAVSSLNIILELAVSMLKKNGLFIPMKSNVIDEFNNSINKAILLGFEFIKKIEYILPIENANRSLLIYEKIKKTDNKYPRSYNLIKKQS